MEPNGPVEYYCITYGYIVDPGLEKHEEWPNAGVGNFDDGEDHYISTFTPEGHYAYTVKHI